jgi:hypothetical protein
MAHTEILEGSDQPVKKEWFVVVNERFVLIVRRTFAGDPLVAEQKSTFSFGKLIVFLAVLGLVFVAVKFIIGWLLTLVKWALMAGVALMITWMIFRKSDSDSS